MLQRNDQPDRFKGDNQAMSIAPLKFLVFDESDDGDGWRCWEALASPSAEHSTALQDEASRLIDAITSALGPPGPVDEGHAWDMDLVVTSGPDLEESSGKPDPPRITLALSLAGRDTLADLLIQAGARS